MNKFKLTTNFTPTGDQPQAIRELTEGILRGDKFQTLLGVTGSGKTFTMAQVIQNVQKPTLVISHNKTLAAQLYGEFKAFFPENAVEYFISFYDYYQPEAYLPVTDTYIEKDSSINDEIDKLRLKATSSLISRRDVIVVASVSCIYGIGSPEEYTRFIVTLKKGDRIGIRQLFGRLVDIYYARNDLVLERGKFRARGDIVEIRPAYEDYAYRIELFGDEIEHIYICDPLTGEVTNEQEMVVIFPAKHFISSEETIQRAIVSIEEELEARLEELRSAGKLLEAQRLGQRTRFDLEMIQEVGYCSGIENYSRHFSGRKPGQQPYTLLDFFPRDFLLIIDESHVTLPQLRAMYNGDRSRKEVLVEYGFRLPSALDNRPLKFHEFEEMVNQAVFVSATPSDYELEKCNGVVVEQIIRPTGLLDPEIIVKPTKHQIDDLIDEIAAVTARKERVLVTTLTKRMAEDLSEYLRGMGLRVRYLHSEIKALDRVSILRDLRLGNFDVLVGINLLREGLDLPEVSLVAILDADKEGFLRSEKSLMQVSGRAARNINGRVIFYADEITESMRKVIEEVSRRRKVQQDYNIAHNIQPRTIYKSVAEVMQTTAVADVKPTPIQTDQPVGDRYRAKMETSEIIELLRREMLAAAENLEFEKAAELRDEIARLTGQKKSLSRENLL
ncbi:MAG: excinuclease ABC subunit UvrB [Candidatus Marinimicrobia bacterium]|nr:excinuclease ABC subunit UvrB [Candidatus Neomarinimicrobiota bacterium]HOG74693.1 excinuclease ABC subunit UvrB [Candidatus Neomarinimicrobiota bacterium]HPI27929.1 excinuclease ABC subunit UvrB [Candidatus Neomarinimicrobiota bacterium]HPN74242.1 excinuclease ABC subunit UvrB [Candidatus Neomarinimicrobiota bacterium]HQQ84819.1 excinuclease ABC subunit UvrB [Candidatus Neomarinimicrobiota bacterium]